LLKRIEIGPSNLSQQLSVRAGMRLLDLGAGAMPTSGVCEYVWHSRTEAPVRQVGSFSMVGKVQVPSRIPRRGW
jgi:hypothetical protein